ncbi:MAG: hypothetical protein IJ802_05570 [Kiritimatiellae bacterium]|nr:hypothetical protein [Kiritimatiellia bacterium]
MQDLAKRELALLDGNAGPQAFKANIERFMSGLVATRHVVRPFEAKPCEDRSRAEFFVEANRLLLRERMFLLPLYSNRCFRTLAMLHAANRIASIFK